jgi:phosphoglycerol transferase
MTLEVILLRIAAVLAFGMAILFHAINLYGLTKKLHKAPTLWIVVAIGALVVASVFIPENVIAPAPTWRLAIVWTVFGIALFLTVPFTFIKQQFGDAEIASILYTIQENNLSDLTRVSLTDFQWPLLEHLSILLLLTASAIIAAAVYPAFDLVILFVAVVAISRSPVSSYLIRLWRDQSHSDHDWIAERLQKPEVVSRPSTQKNLIIIYLESLERTYRNIPATAQAFAPLAALEDRGFSARNLQQVHGAHLTVGGIIASQAGVPFLSQGVRSAERIARTSPQDSSFMPGLSSLGRLLSDEGYTLTYLNGSDASMFAIDRFLKTHGYSRITGMGTDPRWQHTGNRNVWGLPDNVLFVAAVEEVEALHSLGVPYSMSILTTATHGPDGYPDDDFSWDGDGPANSMVRAIACTARNVSMFLNHLESRGMMENCLVAIMSDHLAMPNILTKELRMHEDQRRNYFVILGAEPGHVNCRPATTLDVFPTLVEALGYKLKDGKANLGTSLTSETPTLLEQIPRAQIDQALKNSLALRRALWADRIL